MKQFAAPQETFSDLDTDAAATIVAKAADVALILDRDGIIRDMAIGSDDFVGEECATWRGRAWADVVTPESRGKVGAMLREASAETASRWRHVNHATARGGDIPVLYSAIQVGASGRIVAIGRDLRAMAVLQQRLVEAQQSIERDYWRLRNAETRYRLLFETASEAVLVVEPSSLKVTEANPAALELVGETSRRVVGQVFPIGLDAESARAARLLLSGLRATGRAEDLRVRSADGTRSFLLRASLFRQEDASHLLVRLMETGRGAGETPTKRQATLAASLENAPDGFVVTDQDGTIVLANRAFLNLAELGVEDQARGQPLDRWLGSPGIHFDVLMANLRQHGAVRLFTAPLRGELGATTDVEISAAMAPAGEPPCIGFTIRNIAPRLAPDPRAGRETPRSVEQLTELIGRVPLKDLVREATDLIERLCIESALQLTGDNRASAAEMLGLSRQSLYVKLRRYGIADIAVDGEAEA